MCFAHWEAWIWHAQYRVCALDFNLIKDRIEATLVFESAVLKTGVRKEALHPLHYLFLSGEEMPRSEFKTMMGLSDRLVTDALGALVKRGLPQNALRFLFPRLWPEAEADSAG